MSLNFAILCALIAASSVYGLPQRSFVSSPSPDPVPILSQSHSLDPDGSYQYNYESADGSSQQQSGQLKDLSPEEPAESVQGSYSFIDSEGGQHSVSYVADENGYRPVSADLPVGPPVPEAIVKSLEYILSHPSKESSESS